MSGPWENLPPASKPPSPQRGRIWLWLGALAALGLMVIALDRLFPGSRNSANTVDIVYTLALLAMLSTGLLVARQASWRRTALSIALWLGLSLMLVLAYAWQEPLKNAALHLRAQLLPGYAVTTGARQLTIAESEGGHFMVIGAANGAAMRFLVDTGASDIVLSPSDARKAGIDPESLRYDKPYATANGVGFGASATLDRLEIGAISLSNVRVSVQQAEMGTSLLGMTFLRRLKSYAVQDRKLVLRW